MSGLTKRIVRISVLVSTASFAQDRASLGITGQVKAAFDLEAVATYSRTGAIVRTERQGEAAVGIWLQAGARTDGHAHEGVVVVALRTNAVSYRLLVTPSTQRTPSRSHTALAPSGNGTLIAATASADFRGAKTVVIRRMKRNLPGEPAFQPVDDFPHPTTPFWWKFA